MILKFLNDIVIVMYLIQESHMISIRVTKIREKILFLRELIKKKVFQQLIDRNLIRNSMIGRYNRWKVCDNV